MRLVAGRIAIAAVLILIGGGLAVYILNWPGNVAKPPALEAPPSRPIVHSAAWYVAHPDILHEDERRCAGDAATISRAACQNVASADAQLNVIEMQNAAAANGDAAPPVGAGSKPK
jgi:hypothetical protein